jgi:glutamyl/glutaminyl-tRNA synthetase
MRIEDLDAPRVRPGAAERILSDLSWLGLDWEEEPYSQSKRGDLYAAAFERLVEDRRVYPCFCTRRDIQSAASAPQAPGDEVRYPGTCRGLAQEEIRERRLSKRHAGTSIEEIRSRGLAPEEVLGRLAHLLGLREGPEPVALFELTRSFSFEKVKKAPGGILVGSSLG